MVGILKHRRQIEQWFYNRYGIILSSQVSITGASADKPVTSKSRSKPDDSGETCWPGKTCDALLQHCDDLLERVYQPEKHPHLEQQYRRALRLWHVFALWYMVATIGCNDHDSTADRQTHADELQTLADEFILVELMLCQQLPVKLCCGIYNPS
eukprot:jgi/Tetstr1/431987/TSEL_021464.t1